MFAFLFGWPYPPIIARALHGQAVPMTHAVAVAHPHLSFVVGDEARALHLAAFPLETLVTFAGAGHWMALAASKHSSPLPVFGSTPGQTPLHFTPKKPGLQRQIGV
jgi:hypothetical protein